MILISNVTVPLDTDFGNLKGIAAKELRINESLIKSARLHRKSVDARKKDKVCFCISIVAEVLADSSKIIKKCKNAKEYSSFKGRRNRPRNS